MTIWACYGSTTEPCPEHGSGPKSDREAEKHTKVTGHATWTSETGVHDDA